MFRNSKFSLSLKRTLNQAEMKSSRLLLLCLAIFFGGMVTAQENDVRKELRQKGDLTEAVFYHENGQIAQKGTYKDNKLHGEWVAYDIKGNKTAIGKYSEGIKTGKWFFWTEERLSEVDYLQNTIASVTHWKNDEMLVSK